MTVQQWKMFNERFAEKSQLFCLLLRYGKTFAERNSQQEIHHPSLRIHHCSAKRPLVISIALSNPRALLSVS